MASANLAPSKPLRATTVRAGDGDAQPEQIEVKTDPDAAVTSQNALDLGSNPLLIAGAQQSQTLLSGALSCLEGMHLFRRSFRFRGDPTLNVGALVSVRGATSLLTRQKFVLDKGLYADCEMAAPTRATIPCAPSPPRAAERRAPHRHRRRRSARR